MKVAMSGHNEKQKRRIHTVAAFQLLGKEKRERRKYSLFGNGKWAT